MPNISENDFPHIELAEQGSTPATPATGIQRLFAKADGLYLVDDAGVVTGPLGAGGVESGSSFPVSPTTGDRYRRSDLDYMVFFYDGSRWLSEQVYTVDVPSAGNITAAYADTRFLLPADTWLEALEFGGVVNGTNNGSNYWTVAVTALPSSTTCLSLNTSAIAGSTYVHLTDDTPTQPDAADTQAILSFAKTGSPASFYPGCRVRYRLVAV